MNRAAFFAAVRGSLFGGHLNPNQVMGMETIIDAAPAAMSAEHLAYCLATAKHETAHTMQPIKEYGGTAYYTRMYDIRGQRPDKAKELGNMNPGDGAKFCGKGYVQLTGRSNYARASNAVGHDFLKDPDLVMRPDIAAEIMFRGMTDGWFTGRKLSHYFNDNKNDAYSARRIVNGLDKATDIARLHQNFLAALRAGGWSADPRPVIPTPVKPTPRPPPPVLEDKGGFWANLWAAMKNVRRS